eukprot:5208333-Pyramimonas_sp.AAC.1
MGSSGRAAGIVAVRASFHESWALRRALDELRGDGVAERSLVLTSSTAGARWPHSPPEYLRVMPSLLACRLRVRSLSLIHI